MSSMSAQTQTRHASQSAQALLVFELAIIIPKLGSLVVLQLNSLDSLNSNPLDWQLPLWVLLIAFVDCCRCRLCEGFI